MIAQEEIISIVRKQGPVLPAQLSKKIGTDILIASAYLAELVDSKKLKISNIKVGSSPVYYIEEQKPRLQEFYEYLNEKDKRAFDLLKDKKVLKDTEMEPLTRVALRNIKDFAVPLQVTHNGTKTVFWKWFLLSKDEAEMLIKVLLQPGQEPEKKIEPEIPVKEPERKIEKPVERAIELHKKIEPVQRTIEPIKTPGSVKDTQKPEVSGTTESGVQKPIQKPDPIKKESVQKPVLEKKIEPIEKQKPLAEATPKKQGKPDDFLFQLKNYLMAKKIEIVEHTVVRKGAEVDLILKVPSVVGRLEYYCKAKNKKRVSDSDLTNAFVQGQLKKVPAMIITTGDLTKKAEELMKTEFRKSLVVQKI